MPGKVGFIQSGNIGDLIIALPIAQAWIERGYEVHWPIDETHLEAFSYAEPNINFIPLNRADADFDYDTPRRFLEELGCKPIISLLISVRDRKIDSEALGRSLKFDEYKYAIAGVPFSRKWDLRLRRNPQREQALYDRLNLDPPYLCVHNKGSNFSLDLQLNPQLIGGRQVVMIEPLTNNIFDWLQVLERADFLILIDSCFANLVEQMNLKTEKLLVLRSNVSATPVYKNGWKFASVEP